MAKILMSPPRVEPSTKAAIAETFETAGGGVNYLINAFPRLYRTTLKEIKGKFSREELWTFCDCMNGVMLLPQLAGQHLDANLGDAFDLDGLAEKWDVDETKLLEALSSLSRWQLVCLEIFIASLWRDPDTMETNIKILV